MTASVTPSLGSSQSPSPSIGFDATETAPADIGAGDGDGDVSGNNDDDDGGGSNGLSAGAIIGISIAAIIVAIMLILCLVFVVFGSRKRDNGDGAGQGQQPAVYSSSDAAATPPPPPPPAVVPPPFAKDEARDMGAPDGGAGVGDPTEAAAAAAAATAAAAAAKDAPASSTDPTGALVVPDQADGEQGAMVAALARGPTPPPHDYVLGAGPAASRTDFDNLQARFEREEIGDHSAVLGVDRTSTGEPLAAAAILPAMAEDSDQQEEQDGGAVDDQGDTLPGPLGNEQVDSGLPDREAINVPTFEKQEQMMAGGDGSGAISNVAGGLHGTTITEEGGDVPSLERDPIEMSRDRDTPF